MAAVVASAVVAATRLVATVPDWYQGSDEAILEIDTLHAIRGLSSGSVNAFWTYGPYSRYGWRHPGPLYFYLLAPVYALGGFNSAALKLGALLINLTSLALIAWVATRHAARVPRLAVIGSICLFAALIAEALPSVWNPHVIMLPFALSLVLAAAAGSGNARYLPALAVAASFVAQTNLSLAPVSAAIALTAMVLLYRRLIQDDKLRFADAMRRTIRPLAVSALVSLVLWAPPLLEQFRSRRGNLGLLMAFFSDPGHRGQLAIDAWRAWADSLSLFIRAKPVIPWGASFEPSGGWTASLEALGMVGLLYATSHTKLSREHPLLRSLGTLVLVGSLVALWSCTRIEGGINGYSVFWISSLGVLGVAALGGLGAAWLADRLRVPESAPSAWLVHGIAIAGVAIVAVLGSMELQNQRLAAERRALVVPTVPRLVDGLRIYMAKRGIHRPLLDIRGQWGDAAGVLLNLYRGGERLAVTSEWEFMFGPQFRRSGTEDGVFELGLRSDHYELAGRPGDVEVAAYDRTCIHTIETP